MKKIEMPTRESKNFLEVFEMFVISQAAKGVSDITIRNYRYHMRNMSTLEAESPIVLDQVEYIQFADGTKLPIPAGALS